MRALDNSQLLWQRAGLAYSTHSAYAASLVTSVGCYWRGALRLLLASVAAYFALELVMRYHGILDVASSALVAAAASLGVSFLVRRAYSTRQEDSSQQPRSVA